MEQNNDGVGQISMLEPEQLRTRISYLAGLIGDRKSAATIAGVSTDSLQRYIRGEVSPSFAAMARLCHAAKHSLDWLATGHEPAHAHHAPEPPGLEDFGLVPLYDVEASAGHGRVIEAEPILDYLAFRRAWLRERGLNPARCALISVRGDSMEPTLHPGDVVLLDLSDLYTRSDGLYALRLDGGLLVKRLQRLADGVIEVISDNPAYRRFALPDAWQGPTQQLIGRVVWAGVRF